MLLKEQEDRKKRIVLKKSVQDYYDYFGITWEPMHENQVKLLKNAEKILFLQYINHRRKSLDIGCGSGKNSFLLSQRGVKTIGLDISTRTTLLAKGVNNKQICFTVGDVEYLPFKNQSFDFILCLGVLGHLPSRQSRIRAIKEINRIAKKGSLVFISFWNIFSPRTNFLPRTIIQRTVEMLRKKNFKDEKDSTLCEYFNLNKSTYVHLFSLFELTNIVLAGGLKIFKKLGIDLNGRVSDKFLKIMFSDELFIIATSED